MSVTTKLIPINSNKATDISTKNIEYIKHKICNTITNSHAISNTMYHNRCKLEKLYCENSND